MHAVQSPPSPDLLDDDPRVVIGALQDLDLGVFEYDLVRGRQRYSATCKRLWGLRPDEAATPERIEMLIHPEDRHALAVAYASLQPDGPGQFAVEHRIVRADGVERWLHVRGRTIFEGTGSARRAIRSIGTMQDVTDLRQRPANRRTSEVRHAFMMTLENRLRPLSAPKQIKFEAARLLARGLGVERVGYAEDTGDGLSARIVNCYADGLATLHGTVGYAGFGADVPQKFRAGRMLIRSDAAHDPALTESERRAYRAIGVAATINVPLVKNGRPVALLFVHAANARDWSAEELALVEAVARRTWDAVERARAERLARQATRELRARSERLRLAFEATGMSPWRADLRANRFEASEEAVALHGLPMAEGAWTIERASEVIHPDDRARVYEALAHAAREGVSAQVEYRTLWPDGTVRWVANAARGELDERGRPTGRVHGTVRDVSGRREAVERLAASEARLRRADRQKDRFLATLSHELRNPLAPIRTAAQLLASPKIRGDQLAWAQQVIQRQVGHMALLLDDLLDVARITQGKLELKKERVALSAVVDASVETARPVLERKNHDLIVALPAEERLLDADPLRLAQVLSNLLTNAAKYTDPGGHVVLRASADASELRIEVEDDGIGIEREAMEHLFEMFAQAPGGTARAEGGLGIGLALVKGLVELHGGTIDARSAGPGCGTTFRISLPLPTSEAAATAPVPRAPVPGPRRMRVLVVDDNRDGADSLAMLLELQGHEVRTAYSGRGGVALAATFMPQVAFVDLGMPDMDGCEVARELRSRPDGAALRLFALTGWGQDGDRQRTDDAGFDAHLVKPIDPERIEALLSSAAAPR